MFKIITLKQEKISQSDPVLIRQIKKKNAVRSCSDPGFSLDPGFNPDPFSSLVGTNLLSRDRWNLETRPMFSLRCANAL